MARTISGAPQFVKYFGPVLDGLQQLGGSGRPDEVRSLIAEALNLSEQEQSEPLPSKAQPRFDNQVHWARFYLSKAGFLDASRRGVWALTEKGRAALPMAEAEARRVFREVSAAFAKSKTPKAAPGNDAAEDEMLPVVEGSASQPSYREEVAARLQALSASGFERFCQLFASPASKR